MRDYRIIKVRVRVMYADGKTGWFEADLSPDCRNVVIGVDAVGIAGSYDPPTRDQLLVPIAEGDFDEARSMDAAAEGPPPVGGAEPKAQAGETNPQSIAYSTSYAVQAAETPDVCEYIKGRWYCWTSDA